MKKLLFVLTALAMAMPATATSRAIDGGQMVNDPYFGWSRVETVRFCLDEADADNVANLMTDADLEGYEACMVEHT